MKRKEDEIEREEEKTEEGQRKEMKEMPHIQQQQQGQQERRGGEMDASPHLLSELHSHFQNLTPDDLGRLLELDDGLDLDFAIPENLFGPDGQILVDSDFGMQHQKFDHEEDDATAQTQTNGGDVVQSHGTKNQNSAAAARSLLASLDSIPQEHQQGGGGSHGTKTGDQQQHSQPQQHSQSQQNQHTQQNQQQQYHHHQGQQQQPMMHHCHSAPVPCYSNSTATHGGGGGVSSQQSIPTYVQHHGGFPMGHGMQPGSFYIDPNSGNIVQMANSNWGHMTTNGGNVQHFLIPQTAIQYNPVQYMTTSQFPSSLSYSVPMMDTSSAQNSPKKSPGKRRRHKASTETVSERSARAESGYTYDPTTGRMLKHGPALMATARDNKEVPVIKSMFEAFHQNNAFANPPLSPFRGVEIQDKNGNQDRPANTQPMMTSVQSAPPTQYHIHATAGPLQSEQALPGMDKPHEMKSMPSGHHLKANSGHGFITSLVTKELQSSTPNPGNGLDVDTGKKEEESHLRGVSRDKWSLFWDAFVKVPSKGSAGQSTSSIVEGVREEAIFLGKFPSRDQAGRAYDIAALKILGEEAETNFPKETYGATLPILHAHSKDEVVAALMKDSELARQRTSKYKGVRKVGHGQFEARADVEVVSPVAKDAQVVDKVQGTVAHDFNHMTSTFNA